MTPITLPPDMPAHKMEPPFPYQEMDDRHLLLKQNGSSIVGKMRCRYVPKHGEFGIRVDVDTGFTPAAPNAPKDGSGWQNLGEFHYVPLVLSKEQTLRIRRSDSKEHPFELEL